MQDGKATLHREYAAGVACLLALFMDYDAVCSVLDEPGMQQYACDAAAFGVGLYTASWQDTGRVLHHAEQYLKRASSIEDEEAGMLRIYSACVEGGAASSSAGRDLINLYLPLLMYTLFEGSTSACLPYSSLAWLPGYKHAGMHVQQLVSALADKPSKWSCDLMHGAARSALMEQRTASAGNKASMTEAFKAAVEDGSLGTALSKALASPDRHTVVFALITLCRLKPICGMQLMLKDAALLSHTRRLCEMGPRPGDADLADSMPGVLVWTEKKQNALAGLVTCAERATHALPMQDACRSVVDSSPCPCDSTADGFGKLLPCLCMRELYCSKHCQRRHWRAGHKHECTWVRKRGMRVVEK